MMKDFEPKPFQNEFYRLVKEAKVPPVLFPPYRNRTVYGVDMAQKGGDKSVITRAKINGKGQITSIIFDEYSTMPDYKWYRNPIKWWQWRRMWKRIAKQMKGKKGWTNSIPF